MKLIFIIFMLSTSNILSQSTDSLKLMWDISNRESIILRLDSTTILPHKDNIEVSGKNISSIIYYEIDKNKNLKIEKDIIFPQLRTYNKSNEPDWKKYRAYFRRKISSEVTPQICYNEKIIIPSVVDSIEIGGIITFYYAPVNDLKFTKLIYPSMNDRLLVEEWQIENLSKFDKSLTISEYSSTQSEKAYKGNYSFIVKSKGQENIKIRPEETYTFPVLYGGLLNQEQFENFNYIKAKDSRMEFLNYCRNNLILNSPNDTLNLLFYFSKIRASESIFNSSMGLVHSPGGGNYYVGIWANDQIEYAGPFFPYLGYESGNVASYNAYKKFLENIPEDESHIPYAFEVDGNFPMTHQDRGDAAMIAYGTSLFLLNSGDQEQAKELWPLIEWSLSYCNNNRNEYGAVKSDSDEMEGRIETGDANLSTSTLYYGGLKFAAKIAKALNKPEQAIIYENRMLEMAEVIEAYFGATLEGLDTYKYYDENKYLRHWICLPLTMGIDKRKEGTLKALFETLWTDNGVLVQYDPTNDDKEYVFWDRATLYALRGALKVGETKVPIEKLSRYSVNRLLGAHVPYPVEAYPENNMKHLSAESALYCRIFLEGLLGIEAVSFSELKITPKLPDDWDYLELKSVYLFSKPYDIYISRENEKLKMTVKTDLKIIYDKLIKVNEEIYLNFTN